MNNHPTTIRSLLIRAVVSLALVAILIVSALSLVGASLDEVLVGLSTPDSGELPAAQAVHEAEYRASLDR